MRWVARIAGVSLAAMLAFNLCFWAAIVHSAPFFDHIKTVDGLSLYGNGDIDPSAAEARLRTTAQILSKSPLGPPESEFSPFVTHGDWRSLFYFAPVPAAGGVAYYPFSRRNVFLSDAVVNADVLIKGKLRVAPPRTLTYYLVHEFTHLRIGEVSGPLAYHQLPKWIMEGICDLVALGPMTDSEIRDVLSWQSTALARMQAHGSYPKERAAVSFAQSYLGLSPKALISNPMSWIEIASHMAEEGFGEADQWH